MVRQKSPPGNDTAAVALAYLRAGLSIIPIRRDGSKAPDLPAWKNYESVRVEEHTVRQWWEKTDPPGIGVICGAVSGNKEAIDFDRDAQVIYPDWCSLVEVACPGLIDRLSIVLTPRQPAGFHVHYRVSGMAVPGNQILARLTKEMEPDGTKRTLIETRGEGGYTLAPGSPPECHENHAVYERSSGPPLTDLPLITAEDRDLLIRCARTFNHETKEEPRPRSEPGQDLRPGDDFDLNGWDWADLLQPAGWTLFRQSGETRYWTRPGKDRGVSATTGYCRRQTDGAELFRVFSSNASPFEPEHAYCKFRVFALLNASGDWARAASILKGQGFGAPTSQTGAHQKGQGGAKEPVRCLPLPPFKPFPLHTLPPTLAEMVQAAAEAIGCDPALIALPVLSVAAGCIGNARAILLKRGWVEPCVLWSLTVAESGGHKSPAYKVVVDPLMEIQNDRFDEARSLREKYAEALEQWKEADKRERGPKPDEPDDTDIFVTTDTTIEKLGQMLQDRPKGMMVFRDEMDAWFQSFTRYKGKNGGNDRPQWLEMHSASTLRVDRLTREGGPLAVRRAAVSLTGTIQPAVLAAAFNEDALQAGLGARFLMAMPTRRKRVWTEAELPDEAAQRYQNLLLALLALPLFDVQKRKPHVLGLSVPAKRLWVEFYNEWGEAQYQAEGSQASAFAKIEGYAPRLMLLHHVVSHVAADVNDCCAVTEVSARAGIEMARWFAAESVRISLMLRESKEERDARKLLEWVRERGGRTTVRDLMRSNSAKWKDSDQAESELEKLVKAGRGRWEEGDAPLGGGHRPKWFVLSPSTHDTRDTRSNAGRQTEGEASDDRFDTRPDADPQQYRQNGANPLQGKVWGGSAGNGKERVSRVSCVGSEDETAQESRTEIGDSERVSEKETFEL